MILRAVDRLAQTEETVKWLTAGACGETRRRPRCRVLLHCRCESDRERHDRGRRGPSARG